MLRRSIGPLLVLLGVGVIVAPVLPYWFVSRGLLTELSAPDGYEVLEESQRSVSLFFDEAEDLATVTLKRQAEGDQRTVEAELEAWLVDQEGFERSRTVSRDRLYFNRPRADSYDADWVRYTLVDDGSRGSVVSVGITVFDTDGLSLVPMATTLGLILVVAGVFVERSRRRHPGQGRDPELAGGVG